MNFIDEQFIRVNERADMPPRVTLSLILPFSAEVRQ
jgi:hypothetical protein